MGLRAVESQRLNCCKRCGITNPKPLEGPDGQRLFWFGSPKERVDFIFLLSNLTANFFVSENPEYPESNADKYDFYCSNCFISFMREGEDEGDKD